MMIKISPTLYYLLRPSSKNRFRLGCRFFRRRNGIFWEDADGHNNWSIAIKLAVLEDQAQLTATDGRFGLK
jgi:hypothetical protein